MAFAPIQRARHSADAVGRCVAPFTLDRDSAIRLACAPLLWLPHGQPDLVKVVEQLPHGLGRAMPLVMRLTDIALRVAGTSNAMPSLRSSRPII